MMRQRILLTVLCFFICIGQAGATVCFRSYYHEPNSLATATGTVQATGRNSIEIFDETQKRRVSFIDLGQAQGFHQGDYVRIYYNPYSAIVVRIKKMTVLEYKENGQNLGNIFRDNRRN